MTYLIGFAFNQLGEWELEKKKESLIKLLKRHSDTFNDEKTIQECLFYIFDLPRLNNKERQELAARLKMKQKDLELGWEIRGKSCLRDLYSFPDIVHFLIPDKQKAIEAHTWALESFYDEKDKVGSSIKSLLELYEDEEQNRKQSEQTSYRTLFWIIGILLLFIVILAFVSSILSV